MTFSPGFASTSCSTPSRSTTRKSAMKLPLNCGWDSGTEKPERRSVPIRRLRRQSEPLTGSRTPVFKGARQAHCQMAFGLHLRVRRRQAHAPLSIPEIRVEVEKPNGRGELPGRDLFEPRVPQEKRRIRPGGFVVRQYVGDIQQGI